MGHPPLWDFCCVTCNEVRPAPVGILKRVCSLTECVFFLLLRCFSPFRMVQREPLRANEWCFTCVCPLLLFIFQKTEYKVCFCSPTAPKFARTPRGPAWCGALGFWRLAFATRGHTKTMTQNNTHEELEFIKFSTKPTDRPIDRWRKKRVP